METDLRNWPGLPCQPALKWVPQEWFWECDCSWLSMDKYGSSSSTLCIQYGCYYLIPNTLKGVAMALCLSSKVICFYHTGPHVALFCTYWDSHCYAELRWSWDIRFIDQYLGVWLNDGYVMYVTDEWVINLSLNRFCPRRICKLWFTLLP